MSRTIQEKLKDWRWWGEQVAHFIVFGAATGLFAWATGSPFTGMFIGLLAIGVYEGVQNFGDDDNDYFDMAFDVLFESLGVLSATVVAWFLMVGFQTSCPLV